MQVALVDEAGRRGGIGRGEAAFEQPAGEADAVGQLEAVGRHAEGGVEEPDEPELPHAGGVGELLRERPAGTRLAGIGGPHAEQILSARNLAIADVANGVATEHGCSTAQVALAWIRAHQRRGVVIPIVGARTRAQLADNLGALGVDLTPGQLARLDEASAVPLGFPHDVGAGRLAYGTTLELIDDHRGLIDPLV